MKTRTGHPVPEAPVSATEDAKLFNEAFWHVRGEAVRILKMLYPDDSSGTLKKRLRVLFRELASDD